MAAVVVDSFLFKFPKHLLLLLRSHCCCLLLEWGFLVSCEIMEAETISRLVSRKKINRQLNLIID